MRLSSRSVKLLAKVLVSSALLFFLFNKISVEELGVLIGGIDRLAVSVAVLVFFVSNLLGSLQWYVLLASSGVSVSFPQAFRFYFVGLFFNNFLPANIGGDAVKIYDVSRIGGGVYQVTAVTLLDRIIGIFSLCLLAVAAVAVTSGLFGAETSVLYLLLFLACMAPLAGFYFIRPLGRMLRWLVGLVRPLSVDKRAARILDYMGEFRSRRATVFKLALLSLAIQFLRVTTHVLTALALGVTVDWVVFGLFFVYVPVLGLAMIPPVTVNGLGVREGLGILLFAQAGIDSTNAFAIEFLTYLVSVAVSLFGLIFFIWRRRGATGTRADTSTI